MALYDSSVLIDYLDGVDEAVGYVEGHFDERAVAPQLVMFGVYQGEVFKSGTTDLDAVDRALEWVDVVGEAAVAARTAVELRDELRRRADPLAARDAFIAGTAKALDERLVVADADFDTDGVHDVLDIAFI